MKGMCTIRSFGVYKFIPPKMVEGCNALLSRYEGDIEDDLYQVLSGADKTNAAETMCKTTCTATAKQGKKQGKKKTKGAKKQKEL